MTADFPEEEIRMLRVSGITFADGPAGRRAVVAGTGLDVWEVIANWRASNCADEALRQGYPWLMESQISAALAYYELFPTEIDVRLEREAEWTPEKIRRELPFAEPRREQRP